MKKVLDKILRRLGLKRLTLRLDHRFLLLGALGNSRKDFYQKALAVELKKKFEFTTREIKKAGIELVPVNNKTQLALQIKKQPLTKSIWITESQRKGIITALRELPAKTLEEWIYVEIAFQVGTQEELFNLFNGPLTIKDGTEDVNSNKDVDDRQCAGELQPDPKPAA